MFEKTDQPGGRIASQIVSAYSFDTGAQYFTVRDERLRRYVQSWQMDGVVQPWKGKIKVAKEGHLADERRMTERWVGIPAMSAITTHLAAGIDIHFNRTVVSVTNEDGRWQSLDQDNNAYGPYNAIIIAVPPPGANGLLESSPKLLKRVAEVEMQPCLSLMAAFEKPLDLPFDAVFVHESPVRWAARNSSKPCRPTAEYWVFHASAKWSKAYAGKDDKAIVRSLLGSFFNCIGGAPIEPISYRSRYWESAAAVNPLSVGCLWDPELKIGLCGDWCQMSRVEGAALSGMAMAGRILGMNAKIQPNLKDSEQ